MEKELTKIADSVNDLKKSLYLLVLKFRKILYVDEHDPNKLKDLSIILQKPISELQIEISNVCKEECSKYILLFNSIDTFIDCILTNNDPSKLENQKLLCELWYGDYFDSKIKGSHAFREYAKKIYELENKLTEKLFIDLFFEKKSSGEDVKIMDLTSKIDSDNEEEDIV